MVFIHKFSNFILKHSFLVILISALLTIGALFLLPNLKFDNSVDVFFDKEGLSYIEFQEWKEQFGSDQVIIVAFSDQDIFTQDNLGLIALLTEEFEMLEYVDTVRSITNVNDIEGSDKDFIVKTFVEEIPSEDLELKRLRYSALANPLYVKDLVSLDGKTTALVVELEHTKGSDDLYKKETIESIHDILNRKFPKDKKFFVSGLSTIEHFYAKYMQDDFKAFIPLIVLIIVVVLLVSFRSLVAAMLSLVTIAVSLVWTMAFLVLRGLSINNVTTMIPPIMLAIAIADSIHFIGESIQRQREFSYDSFRSRDAIKESMHHLYIPCMLTSVTTAVGFLSLTVSRVQPVRELGFIAGVGVIFAFIVTFTLLPAAMKQFKLLPKIAGSVSHRSKNQWAHMDVLLKNIGRLSEKKHRTIFLITICLILVSVHGVRKLKTETSVLEYFRKDSPVYSDTRYIEKNLSGVHFLDVSLRTKTKDYFRSPKALGDIERLQHFLSELGEVDKTTSVVDYIKEIHKSFHNEDNKFYAIPDSQDLISQYLLLYGATDMDDFVNSDWNWTTVRVRLNEHTTTGLSRVISEIDEYLNRNFSDSVSVRTLGQTVLEVESNEAVTKGQVQSLGLAMLVIFAMMFIVFRSIPMGLISMVPNILPLLVNFGIMGFLGIRLNSATSMISAIGIGIIVDDTIHFLHRFKLAKQSLRDTTSALYATISDKGRPVILTSIILFFGFGVVAFSRFVPTCYFGVLSALLMINALWADLIVLPSVLIVFSKGKKTKGAV